MKITVQTGKNRKHLIPICLGVLLLVILGVIFILQPILSRESERRMQELDEELARRNAEIDEAIAAGELVPEEPVVTPVPTSGPTVTLAETSMDIAELIARYPLVTAPGTPSPQKFRVGSDSGITFRNNSLNHYVLVADGANGFTDNIILFGLDLEDEVSSVKLAAGTEFCICPQNTETMIEVLGLGGAVPASSFPLNERRIVPALAKAVVQRS